MIIDFRNQSIFDTLYLHDYVFSGFTYDYKSRTISMQCHNEFEHKQYSIVFQNVVAFQTYNCCFWGSGNRIYDAWLDEHPTYFSDLVRTQEENADKYQHSYLDDGLAYISIVVQLISGDEICITCDSIQVEQSDYKIVLQN